MASNHLEAGWRYQSFISPSDFVGKKASAEVLADWLFNDSDPEAVTAIPRRHRASDAATFLISLKVGLSRIDGCICGCWKIFKTETRAIH